VSNSGCAFARSQVDALFRVIFDGVEKIEGGCKMNIKFMRILSTWLLLFFVSLLTGAFLYGYATASNTIGGNKYKSLVAELDSKNMDPQKVKSVMKQIVTYLVQSEMFTVEQWSKTNVAQWRGSVFRIDSNYVGDPFSKPTFSDPDARLVIGTAASGTAWLDGKGFSVDYKSKKIINMGFGL